MQRECLRSFAVAVAAMVVSVANAQQAPSLIHFEALVMDPTTGQPLDDKVDVRFILWTAETLGLGTSVWEEFHYLYGTGVDERIDVDQGRMTVMLGTRSPFSATYGALEFGAANRYLEVRLGQPPNEVTLSPRIQLASVPWAFRTGTIDAATGGKVLGQVEIDDPSQAKLVLSENGANRVIVKAVESGGGASMKLYDDANATPAIELDAKAAAGGGIIDVHNEAGVSTLILAGDGGADNNPALRLRSASSAEAATLRASVDGGILEVFENGANRVTVKAKESGGGATIKLYDDVNATPSIELDAKGASGGGTIDVHNEGGVSTLTLDGDGGTNNHPVIVLRNAIGSEAANLRAAVDGGTLEILENGASRVVAKATESGGGAVLKLYDNTNATPAVELDAKTANGGGAVSISNETGITTLSAFGDGGSGNNPLLLLRNADGDDAGRFRAAEAGGVLELYQDRIFGSVRTLLLEGADGMRTTKPISLANSAEDGAWFSLVRIDEENSGGRVQLRNAYEDTTLKLNGHAPSNGNCPAGSGELTLYEYRGHPSIRLHANRAEGDDPDANCRAELSLFRTFVGAASSQTVETVQLVAADGTDPEQGGEITLRRGDGKLTVEIDSNDGGDQGAFLKLYDDHGRATIELDADYNDSNEGWVIADVIKIKGGSDLSEQFDVDGPAGAVEPGMVVVIDSESPGKLKLASKPYDPTVAGIISGAGGVSTGMLMGQEGSIANGKHPVALTGRVYCYCDASSSPIRPGDLLTTSATPGHAMKVTDRDRATGAILGKAMTGLQEGKGLVLILVSLQ